MGLWRAALVAGLLLGCTSSKQPCATCQAAQVAEDTPPFSAPASAPRAGFCGDGIWDPASEECDDGSACSDGRDCTNDRRRCSTTSEAACAPRSRDGCSETCTIERGFDCPDGGHCSPTPIAEAPLFSGSTPPPDVLDAGPARAPAASTPETGPGAPGSPGRCRRPSFAEPELVTGFDTELDLWAPALSSDGLTLFCAANTQTTPERIFFATRTAGSSEFSALTLLANLDSGFGDGTPRLSFDGLTMYFYSRRPGGSGDRDLWFALRDNPAADFGAIHHFGAVNGASLEHLPWLSRDELRLLYVSTRPGGTGQSDVWFATRSSRAEDFATPELVSSLSTSADEGRAVLSDDGKLVIFASARDGGQGGQDLWMATRAGGGGEDALGELDPPINLSALNSPALDVDPFLTADERELFFSSNRNGRAQIFRSRILCDE